MTKDKSFLVDMLFLVVMVVVLLLSSFLFAQEKNVEVTSIEIHNPYYLSVSVLIKCDWQPDNKKFFYDKKYLIPANSKRTLLVPSKIRKCTLWPKVIF